MLGGSSEAAVLALALMFGLPQVGGLLVTRAARVGWPAWPAAAIAVFSAYWYGALWQPAKRAAAASDEHCGMWVVALGGFLVVGVVAHLLVGTTFALLARRVRAARAGLRRR